MIPCWGGRVRRITVVPADRAYGKQPRVTRVRAAYSLRSEKLPPPCQFGGVRVWWFAPCCARRRVAVLYGDGGAIRCPNCLHSCYASQRVAPRDRASRRARNARLRLGCQATSGFDPQGDIWN
jgi:hypothetical protein